MFIFFSLMLTRVISNTFRRVSGLKSLRKRAQSIPYKILHRNDDSIFFSTFIFSSKKIILKMKKKVEKKIGSSFRCRNLSGIHCLHLEMQRSNITTTSALLPVCITLRKYLADEVGKIWISWSANKNPSLYIRMVFY